MTNEPSSDEVQRWTAKQQSRRGARFDCRQDDGGGSGSQPRPDRLGNRAMEERLHHPGHRIPAHPSAWSGRPAGSSRAAAPCQDRRSHAVGGHFKKSPSHTRQGLAGRDLVKAIHHDLLQEGRNVPWTRPTLNITRSSVRTPSSDLRQERERSLLNLALQT